MLGIGPVRTVFGNRTGIIYSTLTAIMPVFNSFAQDARMYSMACFFVTASALSGYIACTENKKTCWIWTALFAAASAYTHVYGALAVSFIYLFLLLLIIFKYKKCFFYYLFTSLVIVSAYLPWTFVIYHQSLRVLKDFWIPKIDAVAFFMLFQYIYTEKFFYFSYSAFSIAGSVFLNLILLKGLINMIKNRNREGMAALLCLSVFLSVLISGIIASVLLKPVFLSRFLFITFGLPVIAVSYGIKTIKNRYIASASYLIIIALALFQIFLMHNKNFNGSSYEASGYIEQRIRAGDVFIHATEQSMGVFNYYFPGYRHYLYLKPGFYGYSNYDVFKPDTQTGSDLNDFLKNKERFWMTNYIEHLNVIPQKKIAQSGDFKKIYYAVFTSDNLFNTITVSCHERTDIKIPLKKGSIKVNINNIMKNKKGRIIVRIYDHFLFEYRNALIKAYLFNKDDMFLLNGKIVLKKPEKYLIEELIKKNPGIKEMILSLYKRSPDPDYYIFKNNRNVPLINQVINVIDNKYSRAVEIKDDSLTCEFDNLPYGEYLVECLHDENLNNFLDFKGLRITEGYGISVNTLNILPDFEVNSFMLDSDEKSVSVNMRYY